MSINVALTFRDNVVHRIACMTLVEAQKCLKQIASTQHTFVYCGPDNKPVYVANMTSFMFAFIENSNQTKEIQNESNC